MKDSIQQLLDDYGIAVFEKDVEAFMRLYDPEARVFDAWGTWSYEGAGAWRKSVEAWFSSLGVERVRVSLNDVQCVAGPDVAVVSAIVTYAGLSAEGGELRAMQNRITWALRPRGAGWAILHEHTSAPLGFEDLRAILVRDEAH